MLRGRVLCIDPICCFGAQIHYYSPLPCYLCLVRLNSKQGHEDQHKLHQGNSCLDLVLLTGAQARQCFGDNWTLKKVNSSLSLISIHLVRQISSGVRMAQGQVFRSIDINKTLLESLCSIRVLSIHNAIQIGVVLVRICWLGQICCPHRLQGPCAASAGAGGMELTGMEKGVRRTGLDHLLPCRRRSEFLAEYHPLSCCSAA
jgi:hypothetical protein